MIGVWESIQFFSVRVYWLSKSIHTCAHAHAHTHAQTIYNSNAWWEQCSMKGFFCSWWEMSPIWFRLGFRRARFLHLAYGSIIWVVRAAFSKVSKPKISEMEASGKRRQNTINSWLFVIYGWEITNSYFSPYVRLSAHENIVNSFLLLLQQTTTNSVA